AADLDLATERDDVALDHVHADAAARQVGQCVGGGEAGVEHQVPDLGVCGVGRHRQVALGRLAQDALSVQALTVVADLDDDVPALVGRAHADGAGLVLARGDAFGRHFQAVVDRVAHQVHQRVDDLLDHALVQFGRLAPRLQ